VPTAPQRDVPSAQPASHWYGWQTLTADGTAVALLLTGVGASAANEQSDSSTVFLVGAAGAYAAPPVIHFAHGNIGRGVLSLGLRAGLPLGGAFVGANSRDCSDGSETCELGGVALGLFAGWAGAVAIDAAALSWEPEATPPPAPRAAVSPRLTEVAIAPRAPNGDAQLGVALGGVW
jgi:hypothetical protein